MKFYASNDSATIDVLAELLKKSGSVVLIPTETVYGLVTRADDKAGCERIYRIKDRDPGKRLQWFVRDIPMLVSLGAKLDARSKRIITQFCPGPLMLIVPGADGQTIGFRIPDHPVILNLLDKLKSPLAATSANRSGEPDSRSVAVALRGFAELPDAVMDAGVLSPDAKGSTIVDLSGETPRCLREGALPYAKIAELF